MQAAIKWYGELQCARRDVVRWGSVHAMFGPMQTCAGCAEAQVAAVVYPQWQCARRGVVRWGPAHEICGADGASPYR
jgi:hypothetical protein